MGEGDGVTLEWSSTSRVLITGGAGFIGAAVARRLVASGTHVALLDFDLAEERLCSLNATPMLRHQVELFEVDVRDRVGLARVVGLFAPDVVFHLASVSVIEDAGQSPDVAFDVIASGTQRVLEACRQEAPGSHIVVTSTDKVYGDAGGVPYHEGLPIRPQGVYEAAKAAAEMACGAYRSTFGMSVNVLRLCNVVGPRDFNLQRRLVPRALVAMFGGRDPRPPQIYRRSLHHLRAFVALDDVVDALLSLGAWRSSEGAVLNMPPTAHESPYSVASLVVEVGACVQQRTDSVRAAAILRNGVQVVDRPLSRSVVEIPVQRIDGGLFHQLVGTLGPSRQIADAVEQAVVAFLEDRANTLDHGLPLN